MLKSRDCNGELSHWVEIIGTPIDDFFEEFGNSGACSPFGGEISDLLFARDFASKEEPKETFDISVVTMPVGRLILPSGRGSSPPGALGSNF